MALDSMTAQKQRLNPVFIASVVGSSKWKHVKHRKDLHCGWFPWIQNATSLLTKMLETAQNMRTIFSLFKAKVCFPDDKFCFSASSRCYSEMFHLRHWEPASVVLPVRKLDQKSSVDAPETCRKRVTFVFNDLKANFWAHTSHRY